MSLLRPAHAAIAVALVAAIALIAVELGSGGLEEDALAVPDPCSRQVQVATGGLDGQTQRVALTALDDAACRLGTSREQLLLSVASSLQTSRSFPPGTEDAIRDGLEHAIDKEHDEDRMNAVTAFLLKQAAQRAPVEWVVRAVEEIGPLVG
jgi:hypothetical protein